jgi:2'-5' RNA ligase
LFIAHPVPAPVRRRLQSQLRPYRAAHPNVRWTHPDTWHLTLLFLGSVLPERVPEVAALADRVAQGSRPYLARVEAGGGRIRHDDGVAWLGLSAGAPSLIETAEILARECPGDITTGAPARRTPAAHLTVVRRADADVIAALRAETHGPLEAEWGVEHLVVVRSRLEPGRARYETLHQSTL